MSLTIKHAPSKPQSLLGSARVGDVFWLLGLDRGRGLDLVMRLDGLAAAHTSLAVTSIPCFHFETGKIEFIHEAQTILLAKAELVIWRQPCH